MCLSCVIESKASASKTAVDNEASMPADDGKCTLRTKKNQNQGHSKCLFVCVCVRARPRAYGCLLWCECGCGCVCVISIMLMSYMNLFYSCRTNSKLQLNYTVLSRFAVLWYDNNVDMS